MPPRGARKKRIEEPDEDLYTKAEDLPEERRKAYNFILEDFDKQVAARIADNEMALQSFEKQIKSIFRIGKLQIQKSERSMIFEELMKKENESSRLSMQLAAVKATVESTISTKVLGIESKPNDAPKSATKKSAGPPSSVKASGKKATQKVSTDSTVAPPSTVKASAKRSTLKASTDSAMFGASVTSTAVRQSTRKRVPKASYAEYETPMLGRSRASKASVLQTPAGMMMTSGLPIITPKFNLATPLSRTIFRNAKPNEMLVSLSGSPVVADSTAAKSRSKKTQAASADLVPVPLGKGMTLMLPTSSPLPNDPGLDLDDDAKRRLMALRSQIDNMLQFRN